MLRQRRISGFLNQSLSYKIYEYCILASVSTLAFLIIFEFIYNNLNRITDNFNINQGELHFY